MLPANRTGLLGLVLAFVPTVSAAPAGKDAATPADDILSLIPPKAIAVLQVHGVERVQERLSKLLQAAVPDKADQVSQSVRDGVAEALHGRDLKALRPDGRLLVAIADLEKLPDDATLTFLFPAKNADAFKQSFLTEDERKSMKKDGDLETVKWEDRESPFYIVPVKGYVVVTSDKETATKYVKGETGGIAKDLSPETARAFLDADLGLFLNVREVNARYGEQIKQYKGLADLFLRGDTVQGVSKAQIEQLRGVIDAVFRVVEDGTAAVLSLDLRPDGAMLRGVAQFGEKTATNEALKAHRRLPLDQLGALPAGLPSYSASALNLAGSKPATLLLGGLTANDEDAAAKETIQGLLRDLDRLDRGITLTAGQLMGGRGLEIIESKDAGQIVDARLKLVKALTKTGSYANIPLTQKPEVKEKAEAVGGFTLHAVKLRFDFDKAVAELPEETREAAKTSMRRSMGGDEMSQWFGTDGKVVLQVSAKDWPDAKSLVDAYQDSLKALDKTDAFPVTRKQLPAEATTLLALDAIQTAQTLFGAFKDAAAVAPAALPPLPDLKATSGTSALIGIALVLKAGHGSFDVFVPAAAIGQVRKLIEPLLDKDQ
jgi:hypothetical protein